ncbi:hypothetical protein APHAL10511_007288 [Amanita phalloides]|nr:hypothetical protein APHAL10511_007288 [Amanita phalloides]
MEHTLCAGTAPYKKSEFALAQPTIYLPLGPCNISNLTMMRASPAVLETPLLFAPNVTPGTFLKIEETEPLQLPQCDSLLFPCSDDSVVPIRRHGHSKRKPEDHIPRPPNAFILFRSSFIRNRHVCPEVETDHSTLSKIIGLTWQNLPEKERQVWHEKARIAKEEHRRKFPGYTFRPTIKGKNGKAGKRTVREVFPKDLKRCAKIAELLVKGKKGGDLNVAMQEFDRHHKMEIVTKFEEPITAQQFARSSSVPASERTRSTTHSRESSEQPMQTLASPPPHPALRLVTDNIYALVASNSPVDYESMHSPLSATSVGYYCPPSPLDEQLLGYHPGTDSNTSDHPVMLNTSFAHFNTWTACSSPCSSEAPMTPLSSVPLEPSLSFQHTDYYDPTSFPSFDMSEPKTFADLPQDYYDHSNLMIFPGHPNLPPTSFDFDFSAYFPQNTL